MKIALTYGFAMALGGALLALLLFFAGFHDAPEKLQAGQWIATVLGIGIGIGSLALAMREKRALFPADETWSYGHALGVGLLAGLFAGLFGGVFGGLYFHVINPGMSEVILQSQIAAMEAKGLSPAQIERAEPMLRKWMSPAMLTVMQVFFGCVWNVVLALVVAIFFRRRASDAPAATPPPL
jgi:hypothetical protein